MLKLLKKKQETSAETKPKRERRVRKKRTGAKKIIFRIIKIVPALLLIAGIVLFVRFKTGRKEQGEEVQTTSTVTMGGFDTTVTGTGTVKPIDSYTLSPLIEGKILECPFDEGDAISEGDLLYRFEDSEAQAKIKSAQSALNSAQRGMESADKTIEQAKKGITRAQNTIEDRKKDISDIEERIGKLTVKAPVSGMIEELKAEKGDNVSGVLCSIVDYSDISMTVSFNKQQFDAISVGDRASVGISSLMASVGGKVEKKYTAPRTGANGAIMYAVKIAIDKGVNLAEGTTASVTVHTASGDVQCPTKGTAVYAQPKEVVLEEGGEIISLLAEDGNHVEKGTVIAKLKSESLETELKNAKEAYQDAIDALKDAEDSYENALAAKDSQADSVETAQAELDTALKAAEDYVITSPISGVVLEKHYKTGDTFGNDENKVLMVIADMSKMTFSINVDELDVSNVWVDQEVNIMCDALPGESIMGRVTKVSKIGSGENGVTGYPAEIIIDEPGNLMSGMNVTATIMVGSVSDVLVAPASAIFLIDGSYYATIVTVGEDGNETETQTEVKVGLHNNEFFEIVEGLKEGDVLRDTGMVPSGMDEYGMYG